MARPALEFDDAVVTRDEVLRDRKLKLLAQQGPQYIVSANVGCIQHLQSGTRIPVKHWIEVLDEALRPDSREPAAAGAA